MTSKTNISRKVVCYIVTLVLMLTSSSFTALAAETKTVTYEKTYTFVINSSQLPNYMNSPSTYVPQTYAYDDGTYTGTLNLTSALCSSPTVTGNQLQVSIYVTYSGTVSVPAKTKTVTYEKTYTFVISSSQIPDYMNSPSSHVPSTYYYNDGTYVGTLSLKSASCSSPTPTGNPIGSQLQVSIWATYSGTVSIN
jgi:hypothetical protein